MNRFVKTALAIVAAGSVANATGTGDNEWLALDSEISGLATSLKPSQDGMGWSALLRAVYSHSSDDISTGGSGSAFPDTSGFNFNDVDLAFWGTQGPYRWRVSTDIEDNDAGTATPITDRSIVLEDAYVAWMCGEYFDAMMGQFKPHVSRSNSVDPENMFFLDRSSVGSSFDEWDDGIGLSGTWEQFMWFVDLLDGNDGHERDHLYVLRGLWMLGSGAGDYDGARGSSDMLNGTVGVTYLNNDTIGDILGGAGGTPDGDHDDSVWLVDFHGNVSNIGFGAEVASLGEDVVLTTDEDFSNIIGLVLADDSTPWNGYVTYLLTPEWEVGVRYEDLDNDEVATLSGPDNTLLTLAANWYRSGSAGKWTAQWTNVDADSGFPDGSIFEVGFAIGASR